MQRPRIKRTTEFLDTPTGDLILMRASVDEEITVEKPSERQRQFVSMLNGNHLLVDLRNEFGAILGVAHLYDLRTMTVTREPVVPEPLCPVCAHLQPPST